MTNSEAKEVIEKRIDIDSKYIDEIVEHIGGHPLCLELVCQIIREENYNNHEIHDFLEEISQITEEIVQGKSQTISDLVIGKYAGNFEESFLSSHF